MAALEYDNNVIVIASETANIYVKYEEFMIIDAVPHDIYMDSTGNVE